MFLVVKTGGLDWMSSNKRVLKYVKLAPGKCIFGFHIFGELSAETDCGELNCWLK